MTSLDLVEHAAPRFVPLDGAAGRALARSGLVEAAPDPETPGRWRVRAKGLVGVAAVQVPGGRAITVRIQPKLPVARLLFLLDYSRSPKGWRDEAVEVAEESELLPAFARLFARQSEHALRQGLLKGYVAVEETALVMRGRLRFAEQVRRHHGRLVPVEIDHDDYTTETAENRLLRSACEALLRLPLSTDVRGRLLRLRANLIDVSPVPRGAVLPTWRPSRLNARYHHALRLAELVLRNASVEHRAGNVTVHGFTFDMARVFENFLTAALREALTGHSGRSVQQARHHLDEDRAIRMIPDFVHYADDGTPLAVADAKYKAEKPEGFPDADLYQMLAYCTALNLPEGHLVYAKGNAPHASHRVRNVGITIHQHVLDLDQPPGDLLTSVGHLARRLIRK